MNLYDRYKSKYKINYIDEFLVCCMGVVITISIFLCLYRVGKWDFSVPFSTSGDTITDMGLLTLCAKAIRGDGLFNANNLGAPFGVVNQYTLMDASLHYFLIKILALFIKNVGLLANTYYMLTYPLAQLAMYYTLRKLKINRIPAMVSAIIYAFVPGHIIRGQSHLAIGSAFTLPLICLAVIYLIEGVLCDENYDKIQHLDVKLLLKSTKNSRMIVSFIGVLLTALSSIYHAYFVFLIILMATILSVCLNRKKRNLFYGGILLLTDGIVAFLCVGIPQFLLALNGKDILVETNITRAMSEVETYGLKLAQLLLPRQNHSFVLFNKLRALYDNNFYINENSFSSLGLLLSLAFVISVFSVFFGRYKIKNNQCIEIIGKINLFSFCVATVGGLSAFVGMISYSIRCYNRMSFIIASFSTVVLGYFLDAIWVAYENKEKKYYGNIIMVCILALGIYDQTPMTDFYNKEYSLTVSNEWYADKAFVGKIESMEGDDSMVFVYPPVYSTEFKREVPEDVYPIIIPYIHSKSSKWSVGYSANTDTRKWSDVFDVLTTEKKIKRAGIAGFDGMALYIPGFQSRELFEQMKNEIEEVLNEKPIYNETGNWIYYSFNNYINDVKKAYTVEEWNDIKQECLKDVGVMPYKLGEKINLGGFNRLSYLERGFSVNEADGIWTEGKKSELYLKILDSEFGDLKLSIDLTDVFTNKQRMKIFVNENLITDMVCEMGEGTVKLNFTIPREYIVSNELKIQFEWPDAVSPHEVLGNSDDLREIAVKFNCITISNTKENEKSIQINKYLEYMFDN